MKINRAAALRSWVLRTFRGKELKNKMESSDRYGEDVRALHQGADEKPAKSFSEYSPKG